MHGRGSFNSKEWFNRLFLCLHQCSTMHTFKEAACVGKQCIPELVSIGIPCLYTCFINLNKFTGIP